MAVALGLVILQLLLVALLVGALFGLVWWRPVRRYGPGMATFGWALSAIVLGGIVVLRTMISLRRSGFAATRDIHSLRLFVLFSAFMAVTLAPAAIALGRRARRRPDSSLTDVTWASAGWSLLGFILGLMMLLTFDIANVAIPLGIQRPQRSLPSQPQRSSPGPAVSLS